MFFIEKNAPNAPEKLETSINTNKPVSRVRFYLESHQACDRSQVLPMRAEVR